MFSSIQNAEFIALHEPLEALFGFFALPKSKTENNHLFAKNFTWCLVPLCKMMHQMAKPKKFWEKGN